MEHSFQIYVNPLPSSKGLRVEFSSDDANKCLLKLIDILKLCSVIVLLYYFKPPCSAQHRTAIGNRRMYYIFQSLRFISRYSVSKCFDKRINFDLCLQIWRSVRCRPKRFTWEWNHRVSWNWCFRFGFVFRKKCHASHGRTRGISNNGTVCLVNKQI